MIPKHYLPIREFSRLSGIRKENLRFYDQIGLLRPEHRGENNYRFYSRRQLNTAYLISDLRELGVSLQEIGEYADSRTPEKMLTLFEQQEQHILCEMQRLASMREIMHLRAEMARQALSHSQSTVLLEELEQEPIFTCPELPPGMPDDEGGILSYTYAEEHGIHLGYPLGTIVSAGDFERGDYGKVHRHYFKAPQNANEDKPQGKYAVAYGRCSAWHSQSLYRRLREFLAEHHLRVCGDVYEEYPLDELAMKDEEHFCIRLQVRVE